MPTFKFVKLNSLNLNSSVKLNSICDQKIKTFARHNSSTNHSYGLTCCRALYFLMLHRLIMFLTTESDFCSKSVLLLLTLCFISVSG